MRFVSKELPSRAIIGSKEIVSWFAIFPVQIKRDIRWLETVHVEYEFQKYEYYYPFRADNKVYTCGKWIKKRFLDSASQ
jgi:hypothetical protein